MIYFLVFLAVCIAVATFTALIGLDFFDCMKAGLMSGVVAAVIHFAVLPAVLYGVLFTNLPAESKTETFIIKQSQISKTPNLNHRHTVTLESGEKVQILGVISGEFEYTIEKETPVKTFWESVIYPYSREVTYRMIDFRLEEIVL